jgi:hypothetical protein
VLKSISANCESGIACASKKEIDVSNVGSIDSHLPKKQIDFLLLNLYVNEINRDRAAHQAHINRSSIGNTAVTSYSSVFLSRSIKGAFK